MKNPIFFVILFFSFSSFSQEIIEVDTTSKNHRVKVGFNFSPDVAGRLLVLNDASYQSFLDYVRTTDRPKLGFTTGVNVLFSLHERFDLETGIHYSNKGYSMKKMQFTDMLGNPLYEGRSIYSMHYLEVPLKLNFHFNQKSGHFVFMTAGFSVNYLLRESGKIFIYNTDGSIDKSETPPYGTSSTINISPELSAGIDFSIKNKMHFRIEPTLRFGVIAATETIFDTHLWNAGINFCYYF